MNIKGIYRLVTTLLLSSLLFCGLYYYDNKYTHEATQGVNGLLVIDEQDITKYPIRYLVNGWAFYPEKLLSPKDFVSNTPQDYMYYTSIGENVRFDNNGNSNSPHGSGSYVLNLELPSESQAYSLEIPEVFSSYKLYINDELMLQVGDPSTSTYKGETKAHVVTFEAKDKVRIVIAVADYSHFYSGLVYPPAFGEPEQVNSNIGIKLGIRVFVNTIGIIGALLSLYMGTRLKYKNALIFSAICLGMCGLTSYPLVHTLFELPIFPWYAIEATSGYIITMLIVILHNRICSIPKKFSLSSNSLSICIVVIVFIYSISSSVLTVKAMDIFSNLAYIYKITISIYLMGTSYYYYYKVQEESIRPIFYASVIYATTYIWNLFLPSYEPIFGGWFSEWGSITLVFAIGFTLWKDIISSYEQKITLQEEHKQVSKQLAMQREYAKQISAYNEENKKLTHDFRQHLIAIETMLHSIETGDDSTNNHKILTEYLNEVTDKTNKVRETSNLRFCKNPSVDSILQYYYFLGEKHNIDINFSLKLMEDLDIKDVELCTVLGNICENAIEACIKDKSSNKYLNLQTKKMGDNLLILVENSYNGKYKMLGQRFVSSKTESLRMGIGLESIRDILSKNKSTIDIYPLKDKFRIVISIPLNQKGTYNL